VDVRVMGHGRTPGMVRAPVHGDQVFRLKATTVSGG
jgi:hypothetical protein